MTLSARLKSPSAFQNVFGRRGHPRLTSISDGCIQRIERVRSRTTYVYVHLAKGPVPAGRLEMIEDGRSSYATFQYGARYLQRPDRVAVDPSALPLPSPGDAAHIFRTA